MADRQRQRIVNRVNAHATREAEQTREAIITELQPLTSLVTGSEAYNREERIWMPRGGCSCRGWPLWGGFSTDSPNVFFTWRGYVPGFTTTASLLAGEHNAHNDMHGKWSSLRTPTDHSE